MKTAEPFTEKKWSELKEQIHNQSTDILLLPEVVFAPWFFCYKPENDSQEVWLNSIKSHDMWISKFHELNVPLIAGSRPVFENGERYNQGFIWTFERGYEPVHKKYYLPDEPGFWEATWYSMGDSDFKIIEVMVKGTKIRMAFMICTEMWFMKHARDFSKQNVDIIFTPRSTELATQYKWIQGGGSVAIISGSFHMSSNHCGVTPDGKTPLGGGSWINHPNGKRLALTTDNDPIQTTSVNIKDARDAKLLYPRYVKENK